MRHSDHEQAAAASSGVGARGAGELLNRARRRTERHEGGTIRHSLLERRNGRPARRAPKSAHAASRLHEKIGCVVRARCRRDKRGRSNGRRRACEALVRAMIAACALSSRRGRVRTCGSSRWYGRTAYVPAAARGWRGARRRWCWCANCAVGGVASPLPSFLYCAVSLILLRFESHRRAAAMPGYGSGAAVTRSTPSGVGSCSRGSDRRVVFRVFRVRELAGKGGSASEAPPLNPPRRSKEVGVAHRHNSRQQGKRYRPATNEGTGNAAGG